MSPRLAFARMTAAGQPWPKRALVFVVAWVLGPIGLSLALVGCLPPPTVPVTPANSAQVSSCQGIAGLHNDVVLGDLVIGIGGTTVGSVAAIDTNPNDRQALALTGAILAGVAAAGAVVQAYTSQEYAVGDCSSVVPIPAGGRK